jgi:uncharacterized protein (DUF2384 family)
MIIKQAQQADQLAQLLNLSLKELAGILQNVQASERLLLLENLAAHGLLVFDGRADALSNWLRYPLRELKGQAPIQLLITISGFGLVDDVLTRIEYGVYA